MKPYNFDRINNIQALIRTSEQDGEISERLASEINRILDVIKEQEDVSK
jgi:hypothetical protein